MPKDDRTARNEVELMKGVWEWWSEAEELSELVIEVEMQRTARKGVFAFEARVKMQNQLFESEALAKYRGEWPNGRNQTLAGFMMAMVCQVELLCEDVYRDAHKPLAFPK